MRWPDGGGGLLPSQPQASFSYEHNVQRKRVCQHLYFSESLTQNVCRLSQLIVLITGSGRNQTRMPFLIGVILNDFKIMLSNTNICYIIFVSHWSHNISSQIALGSQVIQTSMPSLSVLCSHFRTLSQDS